MLYYYLIEIIAHLKSTDQKNVLTIDECVPWFFKTIIRTQLQVNVIDRSSLKDRFVFYLRYTIGPIKRLLSCYKFRSRANQFDRFANSNILFYKINSDLTRLKGFPDYLVKNYGKVIVVDNSLLKIKRLFLETDERTYYINPFNLSDFFICLYLTFKLKIEMKRSFNSYKMKLPFLFVLKNQSFFQTLFVLIKEKAYTQLYKSLNPNSVIVSSTFGDPMKRMPLITAKRLDISTILFACRPFLSELRSEDRLIKPDLRNYHNSTIGDETIVLDNASLNHVTGYSTQINVEKFMNSLKGYSTGTIIRDSLLFLFAGKFLNRNLQFIIDELINVGVYFDIIYYREHPNYKINELQKRKLSEISRNVVCLTGKHWSDIEFRRTLAVSINTTAAIDAAERGAAVLWLPYLSEQSLQFIPVMDKLGARSNNNNQTITFIQRFQKDKNFREFQSKLTVKQFEEYV